MCFKILQIHEPRRVHTGNYLCYQSSGCDCTEKRRTGTWDKEAKAQMPTLRNPADIFHPCRSRLAWGRFLAWRQPSTTRKRSYPVLDCFQWSSCFLPSQWRLDQTRLMSREPDRARRYTPVPSWNSARTRGWAHQAYGKTADAEYHNVTRVSVAP